MQTQYHVLERRKKSLAQDYPLSTEDCAAIAETEAMFLACIGMIPPSTFDTPLLRAKAALHFLSAVQLRRLTDELASNNFQVKSGAQIIEQQLEAINHNICGIQDAIEAGFNDLSSGA